MRDRPQGHGQGEGRGQGVRIPRQLVLPEQQLGSGPSHNLRARRHLRRAPRGPPNVTCGHRKEYRPCDRCEERLPRSR